MLTFHYPRQILALNMLHVQIKEPWNFSTTIPGKPFVQRTGMELLQTFHVKLWVIPTQKKCFLSIRWQGTRKALRGNWKLVVKVEKPRWNFVCTIKRSFRHAKWKKLLAWSVWVNVSTIYSINNICYVMITQLFRYKTTGSLLENLGEWHHARVHIP